MKKSVMILTMGAVGVALTIGVGFIRPDTSCAAQSRHWGRGAFEVRVAEFVESAAPQGTILIFPPTGGVNALDLSYAKAFCRSGFRALILERWSGDDEHNFELEIHTRFYARAQRAVELVLERVEDPNLGILGTSVGALHAAVAAGLQPRIRAAFVITGGAPISSIIARSDQQAMVEARETRFARYGFKTTEDYERALDQVLPLDPPKLASGFSGKSFGMILSTGDTTVPTEQQLQLRELWRPHTVFEFSNGHMLTILKSWLWHRDDIVEFFKKTLR